jgi:hypothetical protein
MFLPQISKYQTHPDQKDPYKVWKVLEISSKQALFVSYTASNRPRFRWKDGRKLFEM